MSQSGFVPGQVNWGILNSPQGTPGNSGSGIQTQNVAAQQVKAPTPNIGQSIGQQNPAAPGAGASGNAKPGGISGFLQNLFGTNPVGQASNAVNMQMAQAGPQNVASSILGNSPQASGVRQAMIPPQPAPQQPNINSPEDLSSSILKHFEGFKTNPYWDTNAFRVGYGSDTITKQDGSVQRVMPGMQISQEDADRDLTRRVGDTQGKIMNTIGNKAWNSLPATAQSALTSLSYNYGKLPASVAKAVQTGDLDTIAASVKNLAYQNNGVNAKRRVAEANMITMQQQPYQQDDTSESY